VPCAWSSRAQRHGDERAKFELDANRPAVRDLQHQSFHLGQLPQKPAGKQRRGARGLQARLPRISAHRQLLPATATMSACPPSSARCIDVSMTQGNAAAPSDASLQRRAAACAAALCATTHARRPVGGDACRVVLARRTEPRHGLSAQRLVRARLRPPCIAAGVSVVRRISPSRHHLRYQPAVGRMWMGENTSFSLAQYTLRFEFLLPRAEDVRTYATPPPVCMHGDV
jgi:hypothetical protein